MITLSQQRFILKPNLCIGCRACEMACRNEFAAHKGERWRWVKTVEDEDEKFIYYLSLSCNHCENPECFRVCTERTYRKRRDGIVVHCPERCSGCGDCVNACPFQAPRYSKISGKVDKCNMCVHRIDKGLPPACIEVCPTGALTLYHDGYDAPRDSVRSLTGFNRIVLTKPSTRFIFKVGSDDNGSA